MASDPETPTSATPAEPTAAEKEFVNGLKEPLKEVHQQFTEAKKKTSFNFFKDEQVIKHLDSEDIGDDPYKVLDLEPGDDQKTVEKQFRKLAPPVHPKTSSDERSPAAFKKVLQAFQILGDPENRKIYDEQGMGGINKEKLADANLPDVIDVLTLGKNNSTEFMTATLKRVSTCGNQMYTVLGLDESRGRTYTDADITEGFQATQEGLELDFDNILVYSNALSKTVQAYSILSNPAQRMAYDSGELNVDTRSDPEDPVGAKSLDRLLQATAEQEGLRKRKKGLEADLDKLPPEFHNLYRSLQGEDTVETPALPGSAPATLWYQDYRLVMVFFVIAIYFWCSYMFHRMPEPEEMSPFSGR